MGPKVLPSKHKIVHRRLYLSCLNLPFEDQKYLLLNVRVVFRENFQMYPIGKGYSEYFVFKSSGHGCKPIHKTHSYNYTFWSQPLFNESI